MSVRHRAQPQGGRVQFINEGRERKFAVLPIDLYQAMLDELEMAADVRAYNEAIVDNEEFVPLEMTERLIAGEHPIRVWREHRGLTIAQLAGKTGLSQPHLSQLESGKRHGSSKALHAIAAALGVDLDDIAP